MHHIFPITPPGMDICFQVLAIVNSAATNTGVQVLFCIMVFSGCVLRSGISGSHGSSIFCFLRKRHTVLHSGCTYIPTNSARVPFSPCPLQHFIVFIFYGDENSDQYEVISHCSFDLHFYNS